jgi:hypothetical protein
MNSLFKKYSYHLPSDDSQLKEFAKEVIEEVLKLSMGQVINGTLVGVILTKELEKIKDEL